jgi:uncharacterized lipoprotein
MRRSFQVFVFGILATTVGSSCVAPPKEYNVRKSSTVAAPYNLVWTRLMQWFTSSQVQVKTLDRASGVIYAERATFAETDYADCGSPGIYQVTARPISMNVFVQPISAQQTRVTVNVNVTESRVFDTSHLQIQCNSTGRLERQILAAAAVER